jgi:hypothetical protein
MGVGGGQGQKPIFIQNTSRVRGVHLEDHTLKGRVPRITQPNLYLYAGLPPFVPSAPGQKYIRVPLLIFQHNFLLLFGKDILYQIIFKFGCVFSV